MEDPLIDCPSATTTTSEWQTLLEEESIDFTCLSFNTDDDNDDSGSGENHYADNNSSPPRDDDDDDDMKKKDLLRDASAADTVSTAGSSGSWGFSFAEDEHEMSLADLSAANAKCKPLHAPLSQELEASLTLDDIALFFLEDQLDISNGRGAPPKVRTEFQGDSQNSFTLADLEADNSSSDSSTDSFEQSCLGSFRNFRRRAVNSSKNYKKKKPRRRPLKGILKNGNNSKKVPSTSLSQQLKLDVSANNGSLEGFDFDNDESCQFQQSSQRGNGWSLLQQSFSADWGAWDQEFQGSTEGDSGDAAAAAVVYQRHVAFSTVKVYYHGRIVGDNPSVKEGVPLSFSWEAMHEEDFASLDAYEQARGSVSLPSARSKCNNIAIDDGHSTSSSKHSPPKWTSSPCKTQVSRTAPRRLDPEERMFLLLGQGIPLGDIVEGERLAHEARCQRDATKQQHLLWIGTFCPQRQLLQQILEQEQEQHESLSSGIAFARALQLQEEEDMASEYDGRSSE